MTVVVSPLIRTKKLRMTASAFAQMRSALSAGPPERGVWLLGERDDLVVRHVHFDMGARCTAATYTPDHHALNRLSVEVWEAGKLSLLGLAHSHPGLYDRPSPQDIEYAGRILRHQPGLPALLMPIVTLEDGFALHAFIATIKRGAVHVERAELALVDSKIVPLAGVGVARRWWPRPTPWWRSRTFARVQDAYDLEHLALSRAVHVGIGSGMGVGIELARCGVGQFVAIDPDNVGWENVATQPVRRGDVRRPKVTVFRRAVRDINPRATVQVHHGPIEALDDRAFVRLCGLEDRNPPRALVVVGGTDSFPAQSRLNRLALKFGLPLIEPQIYERGLAGEIAFMHPSVSRACLRCVLAPRYAAYSDGYRNTVVSEGSPRSAAVRLHALSLQLALGMLHVGSAHPRWGRLMEHLDQRQLVQVRMDPACDLPSFAAVFGTRPEHCFDEPLWFSATPQSNCPDCGGTGNLHTSIGRFADTRISERATEGGRVCSEKF